MIGIRHGTRHVIRQGTALTGASPARRVAMPLLVAAVAWMATPAKAGAQSLREQTQGDGAAAAQPTSQTPATPATPVDTATPRRQRGKPVMPAEITIEREVFSYRGGGRRDPYKSLMNSSALRPLLSDLRLMTVAYDPVGSNSVAILRDVNTRQQYRVRVGQQLGRMRVSAIRQKAVQFTIQEYGFNRQETLLQGSDTTKVRNP